MGLSAYILRICLFAFDVADGEAVAERAAFIEDQCLAGPLASFQSYGV
jgi:hypothetical protein